LKAEQERKVKEAAAQKARQEAEQKEAKVQHRVAALALHAASCW
jgi:hypothetical protein